MRILCTSINILSLANRILTGSPRFIRSSRSLALSNTSARAADMKRLNECTNAGGKDVKRRTER